MPNFFLLPDFDKYSAGQGNQWQSGYTPIIIIQPKNKNKSSIKLTRCILNRSNHFITAHVCCAMVNNDNTMTIWICASFSLLSACPWWMAIRPIAYEFVEKIENFVEHSLLFAYLPVFDS